MKSEQDPLAWKLVEEHPYRLSESGPTCISQAGSAVRDRGHSLRVQGELMVAPVGANQWALLGSIVPGQASHWSFQGHMSSVGANHTGQHLAPFPACPPALSSLLLFDGRLVPLCPPTCLPGSGWSPPEAAPQGLFLPCFSPHLCSWASEALDRVTRTLPPLDP